MAWKGLDVEPEFVEEVQRFAEWLGERAAIQDEHVAARRESEGAALSRSFW